MGVDGLQSYKSKYPQGLRDLDETWHRDSLWKGLKNGYIINPRCNTHRAQDLLQCQKSGKKAVFCHFQGLKEVGGNFFFIFGLFRIRGTTFSKVRKKSELTPKSRFLGPSHHIWWSPGPGNGYGRVWFSQKVIRDPSSITFIRTN